MWRAYLWRRKVVEEVEDRQCLVEVCGAGEEEEKKKDKRGKRRRRRRSKK